MALQKLSTQVENLIVNPIKFNRDDGKRINYNIYSNSKYVNFKWVIAGYEEDDDVVNEDDHKEQKAKKVKLDNLEDM